MASDGKWYPPELHPDVRAKQLPPLPPNGQIVEARATEPRPSQLLEPLPGDTGNQGGPRYSAPDEKAASKKRGATVPPGGEKVDSVVPKKRRRLAVVGPWVLVAILAMSGGTATYFAFHENSVAKQWTHEYHMAIGRLNTANASIQTLNGEVGTLQGKVGSLDGQVGSLQGQVGNLNGQVGAQANAKEQALDQNAVLAKIVSAEATVSNELNTCVNDMQTFLNTLSTDASTGNINDPTLTDQANTATTDCNQAQSDNQALQSAINSASG